MEGIFEWVKSGLLFGLVSAVVFMICPSKTYLKHISMVTGLLFLLIMTKPLLRFLNLDWKSLAANMEAYPISESDTNSFLYSDRTQYQNLIEKQMQATFLENGYVLSNFRIYMDKNGMVYKVRIGFEGEEEQKQNINRYIYGLFGEEVRILYE